MPESRVLLRRSAHDYQPEASDYDRQGMREFVGIYEPRPVESGEIPF